MKTTRILTVLALIVSLTSAAFATDRISLRSMGMGRAAVASTRGTDAIDINPANLAIPDIGHFDFSLVQSSFRISSELFTYDIYQKYFTGVDTGGTKRAPYPLTEQDKANIRSQMPDNPETNINVESMLAGLSLQTPMLGGIGFAIILHSGVKFDFSRQYFDLVYLEGLPSNANYIFDGTSFDAWLYNEYNLSYARKIPLTSPFFKDIYIGGGIKFLQGYGIFQTTKNHSSITNDTTLSNNLPVNRITGNFDFAAIRAGVDPFYKDASDRSLSAFFNHPVGKGTGFDIGATVEMIDGLMAAVSITDIGKITWDKNVIETTGKGQYVFTGYSSNIEDSVKNVFKGKNQPGESFSTSLPTVLRIGATAQTEKIPFLKFLPGRLLLAAEYAQGFNESLGNTTKPRLSLGAEYRIIPLLPLRSGFLVGGGDKLRWSFGFGLDFRFVTLDFASDNFGILFSPNSFNVLSFGLGLKIRV